MDDAGIYSGFTLAGWNTALTAVLGTTMWAKLAKGPAFDGTLNPSAMTTRKSVTFGSPDINGVWDLSAPFSFTGIASVENLWGVSLWTAETAGVCWQVRAFTEMKYVYVGDTLTVSSMPIAPPVVGL